MKQDEVDGYLKTILTNFKKITAFYPYPTGGSGESNKLIEANTDQKEYESLLMRNFITAMVQLGAAAAGSRNDNKTAVKVEVDGLDFPVYFVKYDFMFYITTEINFSRSEEVKVHWNVEY